MDYQGSVYYYDGYSNYMKGSSQFHKDSLDDYKRRDWINGYNQAKYDHERRIKIDLQTSMTQVDSSSQQFESLATKKDEGWNGEGLPPVGTECEWLASGDHDWMKVRVLAYYEDEVWLQPLNGAQSFTVGNPDDFRPIRTEADLKREECVDLIMGWMHHAGRAEVELIYDYIAAGKIPNIKLESPHE